MTIRKAVNSDIAEMVVVLKKSMGDFDLPVSENIWYFKHLYNPFGESFVMVAEENEKIIGVRALMKWQWQMGEQIFSAYRAVDTATDPEHQGKGIFRNLTLSAVDALKHVEASFIFNTPNDKSRPGYLKMGWEPAGKIRVSLKPSFFFWNWRREGKAEYEISKNATEFQIEEMCIKWNKRYRESNTLFTPKSSSYLKWRYENNPLQKYEVLATENFYLAVYVKSRRPLKELRIAECIFEDKKSLKLIKQALRRLERKFAVQVTTYSPSVLNLGIAMKGKFGPVLTIRELDLISKSNDIFDVERWSYSLGDLELF